MHLTIFRCGGKDTEHEVLVQGQISPNVPCKGSFQGRRQMSKMTPVDAKVFQENVVPRF